MTEDIHVEEAGIGEGSCEGHLGTSSWYSSVEARRLAFS